MNEGVFYPEDVFHYAYAVFHCPTYRERYAEFLKIDFPRLPLTSDIELFGILCEKGTELVQWHLMTHPDIYNSNVTFNVAGTGQVDSGYPRYDEQAERVHINREQYFGNIPKEAWEFHIGGYQVLHKWLKDRKGRELSAADIDHYCGIVRALLETMRLMEEIDAAIPDWPLG